MCVLFAEQMLAAFASRLKALCQLFPLSELCEAEHLLRLESEKSVLPGAATQAIGAETASAYGYAMENTNPLQELQALATKKQQYLDTVRATTESLVSQFTGTGNTYCLFTTGATRRMASQITATRPFDHDHVFSDRLCGELYSRC